MGCSFCPARLAHIRSPNALYDPRVALAIFVLLIGVQIGLFMPLRPKTAWWTFQSWKYKNPEANEPSHTGYALSALSGLGVIACSVVLAVLAWTKPDPADYRTPASSTSRTPHAYAPPAPPRVPQNRGEMHPVPGCTS